jgi:putative flippase GtrA
VEFAQQTRPRAELRRLAVYFLVGAANTALCYAAYSLLVELGWHYNAALVADYAFGAVLGYVLHRGATFADRLHIRQAFGKYAVTLVVTFAINLVLLDFLVVREILSPLAGQAVAMALATAATYRMQTQWVFRSHEVLELENEAPAAIRMAVETGELRRAA